MSTSSPTLSPTALYDDDPHSSTIPALQDSSPSLPYSVTRTVAIIKTHALHHRFEIERRIQEASFEIVKERQIVFDTETDPETLYELFSEDAPSLAEGPVWVYVLERRRAVEVWNTLMGDRDPEVAREDAPTSLRALYGISLHQNGLMGSFDTHIAEIQIASLFASSPPFPTTDLPDECYGSMRSLSSSVLSALQKATSDEGYAASNATSTAGSNGKLTTNGKPVFRARPVPATTANPDIVPRTTRSAALRAGQLVEKKPSAPRTPPTKEQLAKTFANVPGHKRVGSIAVASTAAPAIAPRMTRAAALRLGIQLEPQSRRRTMSSEDFAKNTFDGVPGHKRRESISVPSVKAPTMEPRLNKSATLRVRKSDVPPTSFMFRGASTPKLPGISRTNSQSSLSPTNSSQSPARPASQASVQAPVSRYAAPRPSSVAARPSLSFQPINGSRPKTADNTSGTPVVKAVSRPSSVCGKPSIAPRTNKSAALRLAKQEAENAAAAAAERRKARTKTAPSSFRPVVQ
ncbi:hypothetical protein L208DRAFT_43950 [Tricholoma matsutake]|nr:hypothetical protein L208DRAFT_43950 [Tricholoma matsutake 945]